MTSPTPHNDALLSLAFSLQTSPGAYAVLVGAGVSAPSGILTAWGVVVDLISKVASLEGNKLPLEDPADWYTSRFGEPARYETLLEKLAPSSTERQRLLQSYFEPADPDSDSPDKKPTLAHKSLAKLVKNGTVRVLVTLNFDRLLEQAIRAEGIEPTIVASPRDVAGLAPLHTLQCCVVHLHGDYLNPTSMLNTTTELEAYDPAMLELLRRILKDYGLILAGWSAAYDPALVEAITTEYPGRYTLTWIEPRTPSTAASDFRTLMNGKLIPLTADEAFGRLADAVSSLNVRLARHPLTALTAAETAKRELSGRWVAIGLHDTLGRELERLHSLPELNPTDNMSEAPDGYLAMLSRIEEAVAVPSALVAALAFWGDTRTDIWWIDEIERLARHPRASGTTKLLRLPFIAGSALFYAAGVAATGARRYDLLTRLLTLKARRPFGGPDYLLGEALRADGELEGVKPRQYDVLQPLLRETLSTAAASAEDFWQQFEILRNAAIMLNEPRFQAAEANFRNAEENLSVARLAFETTEAAGDDVDRVRVARVEAVENRDRALGSIANLADVRGAHLLGAASLEKNQWRSPFAERLAREVESEGDLHPLAQTGFAPPHALACVLRAVSLAIGREARELAYRESNGKIPHSMWLDGSKAATGLVTH